MKSGSGMRRFSPPLWCPIWTILHRISAQKSCKRPKKLFRDPHGFVLGGMEDMRYKDYTLRLQPGDKLFVYTDGVPEAAGGGELFGTGRMLAALNENAASDPEELLLQLRNSVDAFVGDAEQFDDLTILCLEYRGAEREPSNLKKP